MIDIYIDQTGDWATAETAEAAILAAKTMASEAFHALGGRVRPTVSFDVDGEAVLGGVSEWGLWTVKPEALGACLHPADRIHVVAEPSGRHLHRCGACDEPVER
jgi:hypothetical protein